MIAVKNYKNNHWKHFSLKLLSQELNWQNFSYIKFLSQLNVHNTKGGNSMTFHKVNSNWFEYILFIDSECIKNNHIMLQQYYAAFSVCKLSCILTEATASGTRSGLQHTTNHLVPRCIQHLSGFWLWTSSPELHMPLQHNNQSLKSHFNTTQTALHPFDA